MCPSVWRVCGLSACLAFRPCCSSVGLFVHVCRPLCLFVGRFCVRFGCWLFAGLLVCLPVSLHACLSGGQSVRSLVCLIVFFPSLPPSVRLPVHLSVGLVVCPSVGPSACLFACRSVHPPVCFFRPFGLFACPFVSPSVCVPVGWPGGRTVGIVSTHSGFSCTFCGFGCLVVLLFVCRFRS